MELACKLVWIFLAFVYTVFCESLEDFQFGRMDPLSVPMLNDTTIMKIIEEGSTAELPCPIINRSQDDQISWFESVSVIFQGSEISKEYPRFEIIIKNVTAKVEEWNLIINNVQTNDAIDYHCVVNTFPPQMKRVTLRVLAPARIDKKKIKDHYCFTEDNGMLNITCPVQGDPTPTVWWYRLGTNNLTMIEEKDLIVAGEHLVLWKPTRHDGGIYRCEAHNSIGDDMYEIYLKALYKPMVKVGTEEIVVQKYAVVILHCEAEGNPLPKMEWHSKSAIIGDTSKYKTVTYANNETHKLSELIIDDAHKADDGEYVCMAHNLHGQDYAKILLQVIEHAITTSSMRTNHTHAKDHKGDTPGALEPNQVVISASPHTANDAKSSTLKDQKHITDSKNGYGVKESAAFNLCFIVLMIAFL